MSVTVNYLEYMSSERGKLRSCVRFYGSMDVKAFWRKMVVNLISFGERVVFCVSNLDFRSSSQIGKRKNKDKSCLVCFKNTNSLFEKLKWLSCYFSQLDSYKTRSLCRLWPCGQDGRLWLHFCFMLTRNQSKITCCAFLLFWLLLQVLI